MQAEQLRRWAIIAGLVVVHIVGIHVMGHVQSDFGSNFLHWPLAYFLQPVPILLATWAALGTGPAMVRVPLMLSVLMILPMLSLTD